MGQRVLIELPYEDDMDVCLTDVSNSRRQHDNRSMGELITWLEDSPRTDEAEMTAIFKSTAALKQTHPQASIIDCLYQAIVWARG